MKIGVYGISCSGKDTFIGRLRKIPQMARFRHYRGSALLKELSRKKFSTSFQTLSEAAKNKMRKKLAEILCKKDNFLVDGHFAFPIANENGYEIVFTDSDLNLFDCFVYLKTNASKIKQRLQNSQKNHKFSTLTSEQLHKWQIFEINQLREKCFYAKKDFIILDEDFTSGISFITDYVHTYPSKTSLKIAAEIVATIKSNKIALFDCDRTITIEDTTIPFFKLNSENADSLRTIFTDDVYSTYQFWQQEQLYRNFSIYPDISDFHFNPIVIGKLNELKKQGYAIYGLTSGVFHIWQEINNKENLFDSLIGNDLKREGYIISDFVKGYIVKLLQEKGVSVVSVGDSICDIFMLEESTDGFIYAPSKIRPLVQSYFDMHPKTTIKQFSKNPYKYKGIDLGE